MSTQPAVVYANADDPGLRFILPGATLQKDLSNRVDTNRHRGNEVGGLARNLKDGHLCTIVGRGGAGKSILALQLATSLLRNKIDEPGPHAAFYFTLEASPKELKQQVLKFEWGKDYRDLPSAAGAAGNAANGTAGEELLLYLAPKNAEPSTLPLRPRLFLLSIPSPVESLNSLNLQIRQTIARELQFIRGLPAIVIDPVGAVNTDEDLRTSLSQLKELAEQHRTFVFLLTERYVFERHTSVEHYSQSIIHLEHDPAQQQHRRLHIQKARGQGFRSGYHQLQLQQPSRLNESADRTDSKRPSDVEENSGLSKGIRIFPSIEAQAAYAHELLSRRQRTNEPIKTIALFKEADNFLEEEIEVGSAIFLMGPPGTFKEHVAKEFASGAGENEATLYLSFKADFQTIAGHPNLNLKRAKKNMRQTISFGPEQEIKKPLLAATYFFDARSPLLTSEEILFTVRNLIEPEDQGVTIKRAIIWGLRRLYDLPNVGESRTVQFLEALVTFLKAKGITSLLVDWPDKKTPSMVPIVDLCQYIFLTRICFSKDSPEVQGAQKEDLRKGLNALWRDSKQVALLRTQRTRLGGIHHDLGAVLRQFKMPPGKPGPEKVEIEHGSSKQPRERFEYRWLNYGVRWEEDLSLLS
jgi:KaiC/GvpD/RAD55 family RecA-like ATPase